MNVSKIIEALYNLDKQLQSPSIAIEGKELLSLQKLLTDNPKKIVISNTPTGLGTVIEVEVDGVLHNITDYASW